MKGDVKYECYMNYKEVARELYSFTDLGDGTFRKELVERFPPDVPDYVIESHINMHQLESANKKKEQEEKEERERIERENLWITKIELVEEVERMARAIWIFHPEQKSIVTRYFDYQAGASLEDYKKLRDDMKEILQSEEEEK